MNSVRYFGVGQWSALKVYNKILKAIRWRTESLDNDEDILPVPLPFVYIKIALHLISFIFQKVGGGGLAPQPHPQRRPRFIKVQQWECLNLF